MEWLKSIFLLALEDLREAEILNRAEADANCPAATKRAYEPKQLEYCRFVEQKYAGLPDKEIVDADKALLFLVQVSRRPKKSGGEGQLGLQTLKLYLSAVAKLQHQQVALRMNNRPPIREDNRIVDLLRNVASRALDQERMSLQSRFKNSFLDGPTSFEDLVRISDEFMKQGRVSDLKHRLAAILSFSAALRGQTTRELELADLAMLQIPSDGPQVCPALVMIIRKGKTNHFGKIKYIWVRLKEQRRGIICFWSSWVLFSLEISYSR